MKKHIDNQLVLTKTKDGLIPIDKLHITYSPIKKFICRIKKNIQNKHHRLVSSERIVEVEIFVADGELISAKIASANIRISKKLKK